MWSLRDLSLWTQHTPPTTHSSRATGTSMTLLSTISIKLNQSSISYHSKWAISTKWTLRPKNWLIISASQTNHCLISSSGRQMHRKEALKRISKSQKGRIMSQIKYKAIVSTHKVCKIERSHCSLLRLWSIYGITMVWHRLHRRAHSVGNDYSLLVRSLGRDSSLIASLARYKMLIATQ